MTKRNCTINGRQFVAIDYKDTEFLHRFLNSQGKIYPPKRFGVTARCQRMLTRAIKRARYMGLLPFVVR